jgi:hypothetical protein
MLIETGRILLKKTRACEPLIPDSVVLFETVVTLEESVIIVLELAQVELRAKTHQPAEREEWFKGSYFRILLQYPRSDISSSRVGTK